MFQNVDNGDDDGVRPWLNEFVESVGVNQASDLLQGVGHVPTKERDGIVILGMHRSGTSLLSDILATALGYKVGTQDELIHASDENAKGFFERTDVARQNDLFLEDQNATWYSGVETFDAHLAQDRRRNQSINMTDGDEAMSFFHDSRNAPWILKDPRLCLTLPAWLGLFGTMPAVLFTYRHPLEVARSVMTRARNKKWKRVENFTLEMGLRLWITYNRRALEHSKGLCRVVTSNEDILENPFSEIERISDELTLKCQVRPPPQQLSMESVQQFIDTGLQHANVTLEKDVLISYGNCTVHNYANKYSEGTIERKREVVVYLKAMKIYCDLKNGRAFNQDYDWSS